MVHRAIFSVTAALLIVAAIPPLRASADEQWCETDPVFLVAESPIRVTAGLSIDPSRVVAIQYDLHVPAGTTVSVVATTGARVTEVVNVLDDLPADGDGATTTTLVLVVTVVTSDSADAVATEVTVFGPTALSPDIYAGVTNSPSEISIPLPKP